MLFFTDEEPPQEVIGAKRHFFGRPSLKGYKANPFRASTPQQLKEDQEYQRMPLRLVYQLFPEKIQHQFYRLICKKSLFYFW
jgi:hypothetical protein